MKIVEQSAYYGSCVMVMDIALSELIHEGRSEYLHVKRTQYYSAEIIKQYSMLKDSERITMIRHVFCGWTILMNFKWGCMWVGQ